MIWNTFLLCLFGFFWDFLFHVRSFVFKLLFSWDALIKKSRTNLGYLSHDKDIPQIIIGRLWQLWWSNAGRCNWIRSLCLDFLLLLHFAVDDHYAESIDSIYQWLLWESNLIQRYCIFFWKSLVNCLHWKKNTWWWKRGLRQTIWGLVCLFLLAKERETRRR